MMHETSPKVKSSRTPAYLLLGICLVLVGIGVWYVLRKPEGPQKTAEPVSATILKKEVGPSAEKVIDYDKLQEKTDEALTALMEERKTPYGVEESLDMIVKPDESIRVGGETLRMKKILDEVRLSLGEIVETDLSEESQPEEGQATFGIHVVQADENIWDIHFHLLKDYYDHKGIRLSPLADEPNSFGQSSGVGKILKFSENLVHIYNLRERKLETDLDHIYPLSKIVIYNMGRVFALLDSIDYKHVNRIEFDGETLWLPATQ
jgi:hypothetical protein